MRFAHFFGVGVCLALALSKRALSVLHDCMMPGVYGVPLALRFLVLLGFGWT